MLVRHQAVVCHETEEPVRSLENLHMDIVDLFRLRVVQHTKGVKVLKAAAS